MAQATEIRYVALKPLLLQTSEGEWLAVAPGEEIPTTMHGRWLDNAYEAGKAVPVAGLDSYTDAELKRVLEAHGYKVTKVKASDA